MTTRREISRRFDFVPGEQLDQGQEEACKAIRTKIKNVANAVATRTPECREQALAITQLEQALSWAIAAIVRPRA